MAFGTTDALAAHIRSGYPNYSTAQIDSAVTAYLILLASIGTLGTAGWLGTIVAVRAGARWAGPATTTVFVLGTTVSMFTLLVRDTSATPVSLRYSGGRECCRVWRDSLRSCCCGGTPAAAAP